MLLALDQLRDRKTDDFGLGFEVRPALTADKLKSLQGGRPYDPRQDDCEAIDRSRCNLALDEPTLADGDQADIGWFRLSERRDGAVDDRVRRCSSLSPPSDARTRACSRAAARLADSRLNSPSAIVILSGAPGLASGSGVCFTFFPAAFFAHQPSGGLGIPCFLQIL
jgi:hypothetical protein